MAASSHHCVDSRQRHYALIAHALGAHDDFMPPTAGAYGTFTVVGVVAGTAGWHAVRRWAKRPAAVLRWLVPPIVAVSLIPDLLLFADDSRPGASALGIVALMPMHLATATVSVLILRRAAPCLRPAEAPRLASPRPNPERAVSDAI